MSIKLPVQMRRILLLKMRFPRLNSSVLILRRPYALRLLLNVSSISVSKSNSMALFLVSYRLLYNTNHAKLLIFLSKSDELLLLGAAIFCSPCGIRLVDPVYPPIKCRDR